jgi:(E)-4-hydroxy-3-methylbut-2-enyl-diphosphate synthase
MKFVMVDCFHQGYDANMLDRLLTTVSVDATAVLCLRSRNANAVQSIRRMGALLAEHRVSNPVILLSDSDAETTDESLIHYSVETGALLIDGLGDGLSIGHHVGNSNMATPASLLNSIAFGILQATRTRISKTEYISCPSCGRTLFDLQETTAKIRAVTNHLKGVKIAIMGCIVNGPGEMADADFGYVGSGVDKITLYKGKEVVKRNINSEVAVDELINLLKENNAWVDPLH